MVSFGKAALVLSLMGTVSQFASARDSEAMLQKLRDLKGSNNNIEAKKSKTGATPPDGMETDTESWRFSSQAWYYDQLSQINGQVASQLASFSVLPVGNRGATPTRLLTAIGGSNACVEGNPGVGRNGEYTQLTCDILDKVLAFWSLDPAADQAQLRKLEIRAVKGQVYQNTALLKAILGVSPAVNDEAIATVQGAITNFLPGNFSNPLLSSIEGCFGQLATDGTIGEESANFDGSTVFQRGPVPSILIGDGLFDYLQYIDRIDRFNLEVVIANRAGIFVASVLDPVPVPTSAELATRTPLVNHLISSELATISNLLEGYLFAHNKGTVFQGSPCEYLERQRTVPPPGKTCAIIAGANLAALDGDVVNVTRLVEYAKANLFKILSADASICPTPPGCFDG